MTCLVLLNQGILTNKYLEGITGDSRAARPEETLQEGAVQSEVIDKVRQLNEMARMALNWVLRDQRATRGDSGPLDSTHQSGGVVLH